MYNRYVAHDSAKIEANTCIVFSAPKYCDTTENKGAYINIGPELKLEFHKFDAVPHPDIKPMVSSFCPPYTVCVHANLLRRLMHKVHLCR